MPVNLEESIQYIKSVGPKRAEAFNEIGINTIRDLLFYFPTRYLDRRNILDAHKIVELVCKEYSEEVTILGRVVDKEAISRGRKSILKVSMKNKTGFFDCVWFQGVKYFKNLFNIGEDYAISAKPVVTKYGHLQFPHPDFDRLDDTESNDFHNTGKIIPFYRLPKELKKKRIGDFGLRRLQENVVTKYAPFLSETLPQSVIEEYKLLDIVTTIKTLHFPENHERLEEARRRIKFEELFYIETLVALRKNRIEKLLPGNSFSVPAEPIKKFLSGLPFDLTEAQLGALSDIRKDMQRPHPMNRLIQGDVGSGKTIVALISMLIAAENGFQGALMAPTEILADQHYQKISEMLKEFDIEVLLLIGGQKAAERRKILEKVATNPKSIVIGTHALFEDNVEFNKLGLVVIDEQHRFGVLQRARFIKKGPSPDVLVMTATPIPRTLTMSVYGDLDVSVINEMPKNRKPIKTYLRDERKLEAIYQFIVDKAKEGTQSYIVYPLVEESDKLELKAAESHFAELSNSVFSGINVGLIHGKMKWQEKEEVMNQFARKEFDVLISTTVIEVGIDVPSANIILINDANRFGLSQLHQLRGRVGRSDQQAYCILIGNDYQIRPMSSFDFDFSYLSPKELEKNKARIRLNAMAMHTNGFELSEIDMKLRGPGDIFGTKQSGLPDFKYANIVEDAELLYEAKVAAFRIVEKDIHLSASENLIIKTNLVKNYSENLKFARIA